MKFTYNNQEYKLILFTLAGSRFYGTHFNGKGTDREHPLIPDYVSDSDYRGVFIASPDTKLGMTGAIDQIEVKKDKNGVVPPEQVELIKELNKVLGMDMPLDEDIALYEIKKFITLALDNNPNIMDLIFSDEDATIYSNKKGKKLLENTDIFLSKKTKFTFSGYAMSQIHRAKSHYKMIVKYPKVNTVIRQLKDAFAEKVIDFNWITDHFGGNVSKFVTGMTQDEAQEILMKEKAIRKGIQDKLDAIEGIDTIKKFNSIEDVPSLSERLANTEYTTTDLELFFKKSISWEDFISTREANLDDFTKGAIEADYSVEKELEMMSKVMFKGDWDNYRKPQMINYCTAKDLKAHKFKMEDEMYIVTPQGGTIESIITRPTYRDFLLNTASFRTISKTQYNIFTPAVKDFKGGIFARNGKLKVNDPEEVGEFQFQLSINENEFKKDTDAIAKLWEWRTKRNEKRSILEETFGYDTKHLSHTIRLLIGGGNVLRTAEYHPRLTGENLELVQEVLAGQYTYEEVVAMAEELEQELEPLYKASTLPKTPNHKRANDLLLELSRSY